MPVMMYAVDHRGTIIAWNRECERVTGYKAREVVGNPNAAEWLYPDPATRAQALAQWSARGGDARGWEAELTCKTGDVRTIAWSHVSGRCPARGWLTWGMGVDVTDRRRTEHQLRESEQRFRALFEQSRDAICVVDPQTLRPVFFNRQAHEQLEYTADEFQALTIPDIDVRENEEDVRARVQTIFAGGIQVFETQHRTKSGRIRHVEVRVSTVRLGGRPYVQGVWIDIGARKREEDLRMLREMELSHVGRLVTLGEMAGMIAHQLHQPLTAITNYAEVLSQRFSSAATAEELAYLHRMSQAALDAGTLIRRIREFSQRRQLRRCSSDPRELVENALTLCRVQIRRAEVRVDVQVEEGLPAADVDAVHIEQVLVNLLMNAVDAAAAVAGNERVVSIRIRRKDESMIEVAVSDNGRGIASEDVLRVFEPFYTTKGDGVGMGLAISRHIVEQHGGTIWVSESTPRGTTVCFTLPAGETK